MKKIEMFTDSNLIDLQIVVNDWLEKDPLRTVLNIQFAETNAGWSIMVVYIVHTSEVSPKN